MCGIAGIINSRTVIDKDILQEMGNKLAHRGPDDSGILQVPGASLVHRRLSILGLEDSPQPMSHEDGRYHIVFNGEIYNFRELKKELERKGEKFRTSGDTEVILKLYINEKEKCLKKLRGMFAFAIWDEDNSQLFCARDRYGQKPFFYEFKDKRFSFASEIKALVTTGLVAPQLDLTTFYHFLGLRYCPDSSSLFNGIKKLPPASFLILKNNELFIEKYWDIDYTSKLQDSESKITDQLHDELVATIKLHLVSDVKVGSFLSGGVDSSLVSAIASLNTEYQFPTFSVGSDADDFSELPYAKQVADKFNTDHYVSHVTPDVIDMIPDLVWHMEEPGDPHGVGIHTLSRFAHQHVKVVLGGDGGDEMFAGYSRHRGQQLANIYSYLPDFIRRHVVGNFIDYIPDSFSYYSLATKARWLNESSFRTPAQRYYHSLAFFRFLDDHKIQLFSPVLEEIDDLNTEGKVTPIFNAPNAETITDKILYSESMTRMPHHYLLIADRMSMAFGLELRPPLIDHKLSEYVARIPHHMKITPKRQKHILKNAGARYMSQHFLDRTKRGFGFPMARWFRSELRSLVENIIDDSIMIKIGIFNKDFIQRINQEHQSGKADHNFRIWMLINIEVWYRLFFEGWTRESLRVWLREKRV